MSGLEILAIVGLVAINGVNVLLFVAWRRNVAAIKAIRASTAAIMGAENDPEPEGSTPPGGQE